MEQMPPVPPQGTSLFEMDIDATGQNHLKNISGWGKFIAITALVIIGLAILGLATRYQEISEQIGKLFAFDNSAASLLIVILVVILGLAVLLFVFLLRGCVLIRQGLVSQNSDRIGDGFRALKSAFTIGIIFSALNILGVILSLFNA
jgi:hypothetical protein